jgi:hypothetical protein
MKFKAAAVFWVDALIAVLFVGLLTTGSIIRWVLPPGSGGGVGRGWRGGRGAAHHISTFWDMTRHEWGDVHFWIATGLAAGVLLHVLLHWGWLKVNFVRYLTPRGWLRSPDRPISV